MLKKVFVAITLAVCFTGLSFSTGCGGPGDPVEGNKNLTKDDFAKSGDKDSKGREAPDGTAHVD